VVHERRLKPDRSLGGLVVFLIIAGTFGLSALLFGIITSFYILGGLFCVYGLYQLVVFLRMGNLAHLVPMAFLFYLGIMFFLAPYFGEIAESDLNYRIAWFTGILVFDTLLIYVALITKKVKWRGREIFELAAEPVEDTGDGYTPRPRPVGKIEFTQQEILDFARFIASHLVAIAYVNHKKVTFTPVKMGDEFKQFLRLYRLNQEASWINFDFDGDVSVHISHKDYLDYREPLAFDKLCQSLGQLFVHFFELHQRGEGIRIIDRLDAVGLSFFS
jgi:hypothetical protein